MAKRKKAEENGVATAPPPGDTNGEGKNRPEQFFSVAAGKETYVEASCWPKRLKVEGRDDEVTVYSVTVRKSYKDAQTGEWKNTNFFRTSELHLLLHVVRLADTWCLTKRTESKQPTNGESNGSEPIPF